MRLPRFLCNLLHGTGRQVIVKLMHTRTIIIHSLIHDLKVPLAVVELGIQSMLAQSTEFESQQIEILQKIKNDNAHAKQLINRLLDTAMHESPIRNFFKNAPEKTIIENLKNVLGRQHNSSNKLQEVLSELNIRLSRIEGEIQSLKRSIVPETNPKDDYPRTIDRALRNSRIALRLIKHGTLLLTSNIKIVRQSVRVSKIIIQSLIEVFDLRGESISERLQISNSLDEIKSICMEDGVILSIDGRLWTQDCCLDRDRVNQVIVNLLLNSFKFRHSKIEFSANRNMGYLILSITDDGEGILSAGDADKLYFKSSSSPSDDLPVRGHGIGLIGLQVILQQMNGRLMLENTEGQGAKFTVTIPCESENYT